LWRPAAKQLRQRWPVGRVVTAWWAFPARHLGSCVGLARSDNHEGATPRPFRPHSPNYAHFTNEKCLTTRVQHLIGYIRDHDRKHVTLTWQISGCKRIITRFVPCRVMSSRGELLNGHCFLQIWYMSSLLFLSLFHSNKILSLPHEPTPSHLIFLTSIVRVVTKWKICTCSCLY
jgi:hypothetical protein